MFDNDEASKDNKMINSVEVAKDIKKKLDTRDSNDGDNDKRRPGCTYTVHQIIAFKHRQVLHANFLL